MNGRCPACGDAIQRAASACSRCQADLRALRALDALPDSLHDRALAHARAGRLQDARQSIAAALALRPDDAGAWVVQGKLAGQMREPALARASFERALALDPECRTAQLGRAACEAPRAQHAPSRVAWFAGGAALMALAALLVRTPPRSAAPAALDRSAAEPPAQRETATAVPLAPSGGLRDQPPIAAPSAPLPAPTAAAQASGATPSRAPHHRAHHVHRGDTLWVLARARFGDGRRWREIATLNGDPEPRALRPGSVLRLPRAPAP